MEYRQIPGISRIPLSEQVYNVLMDSIVNGSLEAGTELREQHIAKQMGVSATPVREAFKRLASDGLIEIVPYRGAVVKTLDPTRDQGGLCLPGGTGAPGGKRSDGANLSGRHSTAPSTGRGIPAGQRSGGHLSLQSGL